jgi:MYND finger protein
MDPPPSGACAQCGKDTTIRCSGCISGPDYVAGDALDVFPCSKSCQTQHRPTHKTYCIRIKKRKELVRAGRLLKSAFITYKEIFYEHEIIRTSLENGVLTLHVPPRAVGDSSLRGSWGPFPDDVPSNITEKEAALCFSQCTAAVAILGPMSRKLLSGKPFS